MVFYKLNTNTDEGFTATLGIYPALLEETSSNLGNVLAMYLLRRHVPHDIAQWQTFY